MIYELSFEGYTVGYFPTEAEAVRRAGYLPKGRYTIREWERDGDVLMFHPQTGNMSLQTNKPSDFNSLSELYMKASEARFQLLQERSEFVMEIVELRMQLQELRAQVSPSKAVQKPKGLLMKLTR